MDSLGITPAVLRHAGLVADDLSSRAGMTVDSHELLTGRAEILSLSAGGRISAGGATHLLRARDGWCALTLSRADDIEAVPALVSADTVADAWPAVHQWCETCSSADVVERARLLDIPAATLGETRPGPVRITPLGDPEFRGALEGALVVDLTSMWAGPLCGRLLAMAGADVVKVESPSRPDGTRAGSPAFFDWMNSGKRFYTADFDDPRELRQLLEEADIVLEGSRPAALERRGLGPGSVQLRQGGVWLRITGHGTAGAKAEWVAFGDDAAVAGGLVGWRDDGPVFMGDAIADPLTGLEAARAVLDSRERGGGELIEVSMAAVAANYAALGC